MAAVLGCGFGLLTLVLLLANSKRIVWGISGSKRTPCCNIYIWFDFEVRNISVGGLISRIQVFFKSTDLNQKRQL